MARNPAKIIKINEDSYGLFYDRDNWPEMIKQRGGKLMGYKCDSLGEKLLKDGHPKGVILKPSGDLEIVGFVD